MINSLSQDGSTCDYMASNNLICVGRICTNIRVLSEKNDINLYIFGGEAINIFPSNFQRVTLKLC